MYLTNRRGRHGFWLEGREQFIHRTPEFCFDHRAGSFRFVRGCILSELRKFISQLLPDKVRSRTEHLAEFDVSRAKFCQSDANALFRGVLTRTGFCVAVSEMPKPVGGFRGYPIGQSVFGKNRNNFAKPPGISHELGNLRNVHKERPFFWGRTCAETAQNRLTAKSTRFFSVRHCHQDRPDPAIIHFCPQQLTRSAMPKPQQSDARCGLPRTVRRLPPSRIDGDR